MNIQNNDAQLDSLDKGTWPHCFTTGTAHPVKLYFKNRSDADHSIQTGSSYQTALTVGFEVRNESGQVTHNTSHNWTGSLCFDERDTLNLGTFVPTHGWNHIKVFVKTRNGAVDGNHVNDTLKISWYSCDSLLKGDYTVGGSNPDFADMREVRDNLEYCELGGPVRFHLRPGTYQDCYFRQRYSGQSDVNTITFIGDNRDNVIVTANVPDTSATVYQGALTLINVENLHFQNMTFQGRQQAASRAVVFRGNGSRDIVFDNCKMVAHPTNTTTTTSYAVGRETSATTMPDTVVLRNCIMEGGNFGVYYVGNTQSGNNRRQNSLMVENCRISSCYRGIYSKYSMPLVVRNNHITQYPMGSHQEFSGVYVENIVSADIDGNTIDSVFNAEYGIQAKNLTTKNYYIRNNHVKVGDINWGCPVKKVVSKGAGSAILQDVPKMAALTAAVVRELKIPVTVKTRLGWDSSSKPIVEVAERMQDVGVQAIAIHGRTRAQMYGGEADWSLIGAVKQNPRMAIPVIGNGDINSAEKAILYRERYGVDAVMIGRAAIGNPWIFRQVRDVLAGREPYVPDYADRLGMVLRQLRQTMDEKGERRAVLEMRSQYAGYFKGLDHFKPVRMRLMAATSIAECEEIMRSYQAV